MTLTHRLRQIAHLSRHEWAGLAVATWELARAQYTVTRGSASPVRREALNQCAGAIVLTDVQLDLIERIAWALPRAANVVPWRSDCLRQAEAGRRWLGRHGIASDIRLGARKNGAGVPEMHAWLVVDERVVTGGDISAYTPFGGSGTTSR